MQNNRSNIALFIDADNAQAQKINEIIEYLNKKGIVNIRRAYGNWKSNHLKSWEDQLQNFAIKPIQQFDLTKGKNATDIAMTIDIMDTLHSKNVDTFALVSSDSDFTPLVMRILTEGKMVYGFGEHKTPPPFSNACTLFVYLDEAPQPKKLPALKLVTPIATRQKTMVTPPAKVNTTKSAKNIKSDTQLLKLIRDAVQTHQDQDGWANLAKVGGTVSRHKRIDMKLFGFSKMGSLIKSIDLLEFKKMNNGQTLVRDKRLAITDKVKRIVR